MALHNVRTEKKMKYKILLTVIAFFISIIIFGVYRDHASQIPIHDYDERWWVSDSWKLTINNDQPMLLKYIFKIWLLPKYMTNTTPQIDDMVLDVRTLSEITMVATILSLSFYFLKYKGLLFSIIFLILYSSNDLLLENGVLAQSESIFLFLFTMAIINMFSYFNKKYNKFNLILFSIFTGLALSTKLNGILLYAVFLFIYNIEILKKEFNLNISTFYKIALPLLLIVIIFISLNPFVQVNPIANTIEMYKHRQMTVIWQMNYFNDAALWNLESRYLAMITNLFSQTTHVLIYSILFCIGFVKNIFKLLRGDTFSKIFIMTFIILVVTTGIYYQLNWPRYLIHLVMFTTFYVTDGILLVLERLVVNRAKKLNFNIDLRGIVQKT